MRCAAATAQAARDVRDTESRQQDQLSRLQRERDSTIGQLNQELAATKRALEQARTSHQIEVQVSCRHAGYSQCVCRKRLPCVFPDLVCGGVGRDAQQLQQQVENQEQRASKLASESTAMRTQLASEVTALTASLDKQREAVAAAEQEARRVQRKASDERAALQDEIGQLKAQVRSNCTCACACATVLRYLLRLRLTSCRCARFHRCLPSSHNYKRPANRRLRPHLRPTNEFGASPTSWRMRHRPLRQLGLQPLTLSKRSAEWKPLLPPPSDAMTRRWRPWCPLTRLSYALPGECTTRPLKTRSGGSKRKRMLRKATSGPGWLKQMRTSRGSGAKCR